MKAMPASQRPHETRSGGSSLTSSLAEMLRQLKNRPETTARKKPRATREGMRRDSESGASRTGADIAQRLALCTSNGQGVGFAGPSCRAFVFAGASSRFENREEEGWMMLRRGVSLLIVGLLALPLAAMAQDTYPNRTVRWVVP